jgi:hypothetical protein
MAIEETIPEGFPALSLSFHSRAGKKVRPNSLFVSPPQWNINGLNSTFVFRPCKHAIYSTLNVPTTFQTSKDQILWIFYSSPQLSILITDQ